MDKVAYKHLKMLPYSLTNSLKISPCHWSFLRMTSLIFIYRKITSIIITQEKRYSSENRVLQKKLSYKGNKYSKVSKFNVTWSDLRPVFATYHSRAPLHPYNS